MTKPNDEQLFVEALATAMALNFSGSIGAALEYHPHAKIALPFAEAARAEGAAEERANWEPLLSIAETRLALFEAESLALLQAALGEIGRLTEVLRDIAGNGDPDFPSYSQAVARSALATATPDTSKWQPIETAPLDEEILAAINVIHANGKNIVERHIIYIQSDTREIADDFCMGWNAAEYTSWHPMPPTQEHDQ